MRPVVFLAVTFSLVYSLSLNGHWNADDTTWLSKVLKDILKTKTDSIASLHYAASGLRLLSIAPPADSSKAACEVAKKADLTKLDVLYHASALSGDLKDCALPDIAEAKKTIEAVLKESNPNGERITQALRSADRLGIKVNQADFDKILTASMKDDSASNLAWVFNAAALLDKGTGAKYFDKIKNLVSQADEVDKRFLVFDGGLVTTAIAVHGILSLAEKQGKVPDVTEDQMMLFANYLISRKHVSMERSAFHLLSAFGVLVNNHQLVPISVTLEGPVLLAHMRPIVISVSNVFGLPVAATNVRVDIIREGSEIASMGNLRLTEIEPKLWAFGPERMPDEIGFYKIVVKVESNDKRLIGKTSSYVMVKKCEDVSVEEMKVGVLEKDEAISGSSVHSVVAFSKHGKVLTADHTKRLYISFVVKSKNMVDRLVKPHQTFVLFKHASGAEVYYTADLQANGKYLVDIHLPKAYKDFEGLSGKYTAHLLIGDANIRSPIDWAFADFKLAFPPVPKKAVPKSQRIEYDAKPEIKHLFREPEKRPPTVVSDAFTLVCLSPLLLLVILWFRIGLNFGNMPVSIWTLFFHIGLAALFGLYFVFWLQLDMFETLKYLAAVGAFTYLAGNRVLRAIAEKRKQKVE